MMREPGTLLRAAGLSCLCWLAVGCGASDRAPVSGKVEYLGQPAQNANVTIIADDGRHGSAVADTEGQYKVPNAPIGPTKVTVSGPNADEPGPQIPGQYGDPATTPLTFTVKSGKNKLDIEVK